MKWHNRDKKLKQRRSQRDMAKAFKTRAEKDSKIEKKFSKFKKKLKQAEHQVEMDDEDYDDNQ
jgi:hypothetical protein